MSKINRITAFLIIFCCLFLLGNSVYAKAPLLDSCDSPGAKQEKFTASGCDTLTSTRTCCQDKKWSMWGKECGSYEWSCRQMPASYCAGVTGGMTFPVDGNANGTSCDTYAEVAYYSTAEGGAKAEVGAKTICYQCKCGMIPTEPECNCSGTRTSTCTAWQDGVAYEGQRTCFGGCFWNDCIPKDHPEGEYCGLEAGKVYPCTPAGFTEHGGYQVCEPSTTDSGQWQISECRACGANQCLAKYEGVVDWQRYQCVSRPSGGKDAKGSYTCEYECSSMGTSDLPWRCKPGTTVYTSCNDGYTFSGGNCFEKGGAADLEPSLPGKEIIETPEQI